MEANPLGLEDAPLLCEWLLMCATNAEFVSNYNRLCGTAITFKVPDRTLIERAIDAATGYSPEPMNEAGDMADFVRWCIDCYTRIPLYA